MVEKQSHHREKLLHVCELVMKVLLEEVRRRSLRQAGPESLLADPRGRWTAHSPLSALPATAVHLWKVEV